MPSRVSIFYNDFWTMPGTLAFDISYIITAVPTWNQIYGYSSGIVVALEGWINGSRNIID